MEKRRLQPTARTTPHRLAGRAGYDIETIHAILDEALVCHLSVAGKRGPRVLPTLHVRLAERLYVHGSAASALLRDARDGGEICVAVTLLDGLVLARSAFHHSVNYRCVVLFGRATEETDPERKRAVLAALVEHVMSGRGDDCRPPSDAELKATMVLSLPIEEASAKIRTGPVSDDPADLDLPHWAGVIPLRLTAGDPEPDPDRTDGVAVPEYVERFCASSRAFLPPAFGDRRS